MASFPPPEGSEESIKDEIDYLEGRLREAKSRLQAINPSHDTAILKTATSPSIPLTPSTSTHFLLLLADSALPIGSFAFSNGLESYLAHTRPSPRFSDFLPLSLSSIASSTLPYVLAAHQRPTSLPALDDLLDASTICTVARRASTAQGRALLSIWERSFSPSTPFPATTAEHECLRSFAALLRRESRAKIPLASAHLAPLFGAIAAVQGLTAAQTAYVFLLGHVKALVSAAVRANMFGPYQAQRVLAGGEVQRLIGEVVRREWDTGVEEAGQSVPVVDLWMGRHETLYSRIFNS